MMDKYISAPVILTLPHMLNTSKEYQKTTKGQLPDAKKHQIFLDLEQKTGFPLRGSKRVQFNMFIRKFDQIVLTENLNTILMPIVWIDEGIELNDEMVQLLNDKLFIILLLLDILTWTMMIGGGIAAILLLSWYIYNRQQSNKVYTFS